MVLSGPGAAIAADWTITPSIAIGEGFNDNVNLATSGQAKADFFTTINPTINIRDAAPRLNLNVTYSPVEILYYGESSAQQLQQQLLGNVQATIFPDILFLNADASVSKQFVSGTGPVAASTFSTSNNLQTVQAYDVSPILKHHFGPYADSQTRYTYTYVESGGQALPPSQTNEFNQTISSGEYFGRVGWNLTADRLQESNAQNVVNPGLSQANDFFSPNTFASGTSYKDEYVSAQAQYALFNTLAPTATIGWEHIASPTLSIPPYEIFWNVGFIWTPNERTSLTITYGDRYGGTNMTVNGKWDPGPQTHITINYNESVQNSATLLGNNLTLLGQNAAGQNINLQTGLPFSLTQPGLPGTSINPLGLTNSSFLFKGLTATLTLTRARDTYTGTLFYDQEIIDVPAQTENVYGGTLTWSHQLQPNLSSNLGASYGKTNTSGGGAITPINGFGSANSSYYLFTAGLTYTISPTSSATFNLTRSDTSATGGTGSVTDDVISVVFQKQF